MHFTLPLPPPLNHCYRSGTTKTGRPYTYKTNEAKRWQEEAGWLIKKELKTFPSKPMNLIVDMQLKYDRDYDSSFKLLSDTLEVMNVIENDKWIYHAEVTKYLKSTHPRLEVYVGPRT